MTHQEKVKHLVIDLKGRGVSPYTAAPPLYRMLWLLGVKCPPPHFQQFGTLFTWSGVFFGVAWGLIWSLVLMFEETPIGSTIVLIGSVVAGASFGFLFATITRSKARKLGLPEWEKYPGV